MTSRIRRPLAAILVALLALTGVVLSATPASAAGGTVTGTVRHGAGVASSGVIVQIGTLVAGVFGNVVNQTTNASGVYTVTGLAAGTYTVLAYGDTSYANTWAGNQPFSDTAQTYSVTTNTVTADITQIVGGTFSVLVLQGPSQTPSVGAEVNFCHEAPTLTYCTSTGITNASGVYTSPKLAPSTWLPWIRKDPFPSEYFNDWSVTGFGPFDPVTVINAGNVSAVVWLRTDKQPSETYFQDVPFSSTYFQSVQWIVTHHISTGTAMYLERPAYKPLDPVSRQAMAAFLYRLSGSTFVPSGTQHFADVSSSNAFYGSIEWMYSAGLSTGTPQPSGLPLFKPAESVSRQSMASFLYRLSGETFTPPGTASFADVPTTSGNYTAIEWMKSKGISTGTGQPSGLPLFKPLDPVSRQAMALFLYRYANPGSGGT